jgi:hypothetical protein
MARSLTHFGIPGLGAVPYGIHMCQFYSSRGHLADALPSYFRAGLSNNERCIWVASSPLSTNDVGLEVARCPELQEGLTSGQLGVYDAEAWYGEPTTFNADRVVNRWFAEEERAIADGYDGIRITGNTHYFPKTHWAGLMDYEQELHNQIKGHKIVACCSYHREDCQPVDMLEVLRCHHGVVERSGDHWEVWVDRETIRT